MKFDLHNPDVQFIRLAGAIGLIAAFINDIADVVFQGGPSGSYLGNMEFMWLVSETRLYIGAFLGAAIIPFAVFGFWHVYQGIKEAGRFVAAVPVLIACYAAAVGSGAHFALIHPALVGRTITSSSGDVVPVLQQLHGDMVAANTQLFWIVAGFTVFSLWWMVLVFMGRTKYPRWAGIANPFFLQIVIGLAIPSIPVVGSYLYPASGGIANAIFFALSIRWLWNCKT